MKRLRLSRILTGVLLLSVCATAAELRVAETRPANGAKGVPCSLDAITITFSGPVKMNSWSFVTMDDGVFPEVSGNPHFPDNTACVLPVALEPGVTYSVGINSATKTGFKSADDAEVPVTPYVLTFATAAATPVAEQGLSSGPAVAKSGKAAVVFQRVHEPKERAFTFLLPKGWQVEGGILRVNPLNAGGPGNAIAAKLDIAIRKDAAGTVMGRWLPDVIFFDMSNSPAGQMGMFPPGSNYNGMTVMPLMPAAQFLGQAAFPYAHPQAVDVQVTEQKPLPKLAQQFRQRVFQMFPEIAQSFSYDAGYLAVAYTEGGVRYEERMAGVVENWGALGAGMWGNRETFFLRTPAGEYAQWAPIFDVVQRSIKLNPQWMMGEIQGQIQRGEIARRTQEEIQRLDQEIVEHRQKTNAEISNDMYLNLTQQEEYVNPFNNEVEAGSNQWQHRWQNENGDIIYTDNEGYDPNTDVDLSISGFRKTPIRPRLP